MRILTAMTLAAALASCGASNHAPDDRDAGPAPGSAPPTFTLTSSAFGQGQEIPAQFTCEGVNQSPPLAWGEPPAATRSFALVVDDPDAPGGTFRHWGAYDIPAATRAIRAGQPIGTQAINDMDKPGYGGPCPPNGHGVHHYHFRLFALDTDKLGLAAGAKAADVEQAARRHAIAQGELVGTYQRK